MRTLKRYSLAASLMLFVFTSSIYSQDSHSAMQCLRIKEKCKLNLKQTKWGFKLGGIDFKAGPVSKVGEVQLGTELIQQMTPVAQILDQMQYSNCQLRNSLTTCDSTRQRVIWLQAVSNTQLYNLAFLAQMYSSNPTELKEAMLKWMVQSADMMQKIASNQFMSTGDENKRTAITAEQALNFALKELRVAPGSPELQRLLAEDPIKDRIGR